jgi:PRTRC genetic system protein B
VESLVRSLSGASTTEVLPDNVLAKGDRMIAWWTPTCRRQMFYESPAQDVTQLNGRTFPQPPLVWRVENGDLKVRALAENKRPKPDANMAVAPFWNLSEDGRLHWLNAPPRQRCGSLNRRVGARLLRECLHARERWPLDTPCWWV